MATIVEPGQAQIGVPNKPWLQEEIDVAVGAYFYMLRMQEEGRAVNKSELNRLVGARLPARSPGSLTKKYSNISAILNLLGVQALNSYKPLFNFQHSLAQTVERALVNDSQLIRAASARVESSMSAQSISDFSTFLVPPPTSQNLKSRSAKSTVNTSIHRDYLAREAKNRSIGLAGENLALDFERARLRLEGRPDLAARVEHVSETKGDALGFDIHSYSQDGTERMIEVKTTSYGIYTPIFFSANELRQSIASTEKYWIYRIFNVRSKPKLYVKNGSFLNHFALEPVTYLGRPAQ